jgi:hypothetical protein
LRALGVAVSQGYRRLRSISRAARQNSERSTSLLEERKAPSSKLAYASTLNPAAFTRSDLEIRDNCEAEVQRIDAQLDAISKLAAANEREHELTKAWLEPTSRLLDSILHHMGYRTIEQVLPDFDDGNGEVLEYAEAAVQAANSSGRAFGGTSNSGGNS